MVEDAGLLLIVSLGARGQQKPITTYLGNVLIGHSLSPDLSDTLLSGFV